MRDWWLGRRTVCVLLLGLTAISLAGCPDPEPPPDRYSRRPPRERPPRSTDETPTDETPTDETPTDTSATDTSATDTSATDTSATGTSATGTSATGTSTTGTPAPDGPTGRPAPSADRPQFPASAPGALHRLVDSGDWVPAEPPKNDQGNWEVVHEATGLTFIHVPAGSFTMGDELGASDAQPVRRVTLDAFLLCKTEVSQKAWDALGGNDDRTKEGASLPINRITWNEARVWCNNAGFRLPTEAEWEYAARAGRPQTWVSGSPNAMPAHAWFHENGDNELHPVGTKRPNPWGFHDMAGNVAEWCQDIYADYSAAPTDGSAAETGGSMRVQRGGNYSATLAKVGACYRDRSGPHSRYGGPGVRPAVTLR